MQASTLIETLGPHPARRLALDLTEPGGRDAWLLACLALSARAPEPAALDALLALGQSGLLDPRALLARGPALADGLARGPWKEPAQLAARLQRVAEALEGAGGTDALAAASDGFEELGARLVRLAPGLGPATVLRFLRPLRKVWGDAADTPPAASALAAAQCLGWAPEAAESLAPPVDAGADPADLEAALERLGARACRAGRSARCPLAAACPQRQA